MKLISQFKFIAHEQVRVLVSIFQPAKEKIMIINYF